MGRYKITNREQMVACAIATHDWANVVEERSGIDWSQYDRVSLAQLVAPLTAMGTTENERVYNLHRDMRRRWNYDTLLDAVGPLDVRKCEWEYHRRWQQIRNNHWVGHVMEKFGIDARTMAFYMKVKERSVLSFLSFHEFTDDPAMLHAFEASEYVQVPKHEEWGRKYRKALREYRESHT